MLQTHTHTHTLGHLLSDSPYRPLLDALRLQVFPPFLFPFLIFRTPGQQKRERDAMVLLSSRRSTPSRMSAYSVASNDSKPAHNDGLLLSGSADPPPAEPPPPPPPPPVETPVSSSVAASDRRPATAMAAPQEAGDAANAPPVTGARVRMLLSSQYKRQRRLKAEEQWASLARDDEATYAAAKERQRVRRAEARAEQRRVLDAQIRFRAEEVREQLQDKRQQARDAEREMDAFRAETEQQRQRQLQQARDRRTCMLGQLEASVERRRAARTREKEEALAYVRRLAEELEDEKRRQAEGRLRQRGNLQRVQAEERARCRLKAEAARRAQCESAPGDPDGAHAEQQRAEQTRRTEAIGLRMAQNAEQFLRSHPPTWLELAAADEVRAVRQQEEMASRADKAQRSRREKQEEEKAQRLQVLNTQVRERHMRSEKEVAEARRTRRQLVEAEQKALEGEMAARLRKRSEKESRRHCLDTQLALRCHRETLPLETGIARKLED